MRLTRKRLKERFPDDFAELEEQTSKDLYPQAVELYRGKLYEQRQQQQRAREEGLE